MDQKKLVELVKKLRGETGAGVMECKTALEEVGGEMKKAREMLLKKGLKKAEGKKERETQQGYVATYTHTNGKVGGMVSLLCETDFVARNEEFRKLAHELCLQVVAMEPKTVAELLDQDYMKEGGGKVKDLVGRMVAKFGENIKVGEIFRAEI